MALPRVETDLGGCAILQSVGRRLCCGREQGPGRDGGGDEREAERGPLDACAQEARNLRRVGVHMQGSGADPHDEAGLVQADDSSACLTEGEQRDTGSKSTTLSRLRQLKRRALPATSTLCRSLRSPWDTLPAIPAAGDGATVQNPSS